MQDLLFNVAGSSGMLIDRMKRRRAAFRKQLQAEQLSQNQVEMDGDDFQYTEADAIKDFEELKSIVIVNDDNIQLVQQKLALTAAYRTKLLLDKDVDLVPNFPYFFVCSRLVCNMYNYYIFPVIQIHSTTDLKKLIDNIIHFC